MDKRGEPSRLMSGRVSALIARKLFGAWWDGRAQAVLLRIFVRIDDEEEMVKNRESGTQLLVVNRLAGTADTRKESWKRAFRGN